MSTRNYSKQKKSGTRANHPVEALETRVLLAGSPAAQLLAKPMDVWGPTYTFKVVYTSSQRLRASSIDNSDILVTGPNGYKRLARFVGMTDELRTITARYKVSTPRNIWNASNNGTYKFTMVAGQVRDVDNRYVPAGVLGSFIAKVPQFPSALGQRESTSLQGAVDVRRFGATPDDNIDDSDAIQAAIDSLPRSNGVPTAADPMGGIIYLPKGTYTIAKPIKIYSGFVLRGEGAATILNGVSTNSADSVVRLHSPFTHGFTVRAGVENLTIRSNVSKGIDSTFNAQGDIIGAKFSNLSISTGGAGIDMRGHDIYQSTIENVTFSNIGSTAIAMTWTRDNGNSAINYIHNVVITGLARDNFVAEDALVILSGDYNIDGLDIGDIGKPVTSLSGSRSVNMRNAIFRAGSKNLPNGVLAKFDDGFFQIDWIDNIGPGRTLKFTNTETSLIGTLRLADGASVQDSVAIDGQSHLDVSKLQSSLSNLAGVDARRFSAKAIGAPDASRRANVTVKTTIAGPASKLLVDATAFGVVSDDRGDDTDALQAAIDSLPRGNGVPGAAGDVGGTVYLPAGLINLSRAIRLPSGVWLVGQGYGTSLYNASFDPNDAAILLVSGAAAGFNNGAGIANLGLYTTNAAGIRGDASVTNGVFDLTIDSIALSAGGAGIDLRYVKTFAANINSIAAPSLGSTVVWIGDEAGYSADNRVNDIQVYGSDRTTFRNDKALFVFKGQNVVENIWIENENVKALPLYVSGRANFYGLWLEPPHEGLSNGVAAQFENATNVTIDKLLSIDLNRLLALSNSRVSVNNLDIRGFVNNLSQCIDLDASSRFAATNVSAIYDVGMADDPRVTIGGAYNKNANGYVDYALVMNGANLLQNIGAWTIQWGDTFGAVNGTASIEQTENGQRLKIEVFSNPNNRPVAVSINASVPTSAIGKPAAASWRVDSAADVLIWTRGYGTQFQGRNTGSTTIVPMPGVLNGNDQIVIALNGIVGTAYLSNFRLVAL